MPQALHLLRAYLAQEPMAQKKGEPTHCETPTPWGSRLNSLSQKGGGSVQRVPLPKPTQRTLRVPKPSPNTRSTARSVASEVGRKPPLPCIAPPAPLNRRNAAKSADRLTFRVALSGPLKKQFEEALEKEHNHLFQPQSDGIPCVEVIRWEEKPTDRGFAKLHRRRQGEGGRRRHDHGEDRENTQPRWESAQTQGARTVPRARGCCETSGRREACHAGLYSSHWKTASVKIPQTVSGGQNRQGWKQGAQERTPWPRTRPRRLPAI